jgi:hypothetical protein
MPEPAKTARPALPPSAREELHLVQFAAVRNNVITPAELESCGISSSARTRWVARGRLRRKHQGVYVYGNGPLSQDGELYAAMVAIGEDAAISHISAAIHHGYWNFRIPSVVDVTVPRAVRSRRGIAVHSVGTLPPDAVTVIRGIRTTTSARTICDLAGTIREDWAFRRVVHEALVQKKLTFADLAVEFDRAPANIPGRHRLIIELSAGATPTRSRFEDWGADLLRTHDFPYFETNVHVPGTPAWVEVDVYFPRQRLVIEIDGGRYHDTPWRRQQDAHKRTLLKDTGHPVLVLAEEDAEPANEQRTVEKIWRALAEAEAAAAPAGAAEAV